MIPQNDNDRAEREEQAAGWCLIIADRPLPASERADFVEWVAAEGRYAQHFDQMVAVWQGTDAIAEMPGFLALRADALTAMEKARRGGAASFPTRRRAFAAMVALTFVTGMGAWYWSERPGVYSTGV